MFSSRVARVLVMALALLSLQSLTPVARAADATVADAQSIARLYSAAFDRIPRVSGLNFWVDSFERELSMVEIADRFVESPEFESRYGTLTDRAFVEQLFLNVLGRPGKTSGVEFWVDSLAQGVSRASVLSRFSESPENVTKTSDLFADMRLIGSQWVFGSDTFFTISGSLLAPAFGAVDTDTNDPEAPYQANDSIEDAPFISNPVTLGGYVNEPFSGFPGRSEIPGDIDDYFQVQMLEGQVITMIVSDFEIADADLYLFDADGFFVDASLSLGEIESLTVPYDGLFYVNAFAFSGASNYILTIGNVDISAKAKRFRVSNDFVPGQAMVRYDNNALRARGHSAQSMSAADGFGIRAGAAEREMLLELGAPAAANVAAQGARSGVLRASSKADLINDPVVREKWRTLMGIKRLRKNPMVRFAQPNFRVKAMATPNDEFYDLQWHYPLMNLPAAWDLEQGDPDVVVAVIDTGVLLNHPDLAGQLVPGYDFVSGSNAGDGNGIDPNPDDPGDGGSVGASSFHGTHVAGTVAARTNNGFGVAGVAWDARIMPIRALGVGGAGTNYDIMQAIRFAAGLSNDSGTVPQQPADIINLSLGGPFSSGLEQETITAARNAGSIIVAAAGNESSSQPSYPASYAGVISVSAVDLQRNLASYSNFGPNVDIAAPGGDPRRDLNGDGYPDGVLSTVGADAPGSPHFRVQFSGRHLHGNPARRGAPSP